MGFDRKGKLVVCKRFGRGGRKICRGVFKVSWKLWIICEYW